MKPEAPRAIRLKDYRAPDFLIERVDLDVALDATRTSVRSKLKLRRNPQAADAEADLTLDGEQLQLVSILLDGTPLSLDRYVVTETALTINNLHAKPFTLEITTLIDPDANKALQGLYRSRGIFCTQCEAQGFRRITYFLDRPDVLATYTCRIEADAAEAGVLLSNGNLVERGTLDRGKRHYAVWKDPHPKPCYLFALVGGNLGSIASTFRTRSGRDVDLRIYVEPGKEPRAHWAMDSLKRSMKWDEERFSLEYDLDCFNIVAVSDFNLGAMENKGLNIFNDRLILASPETATDTMFEAIESVVAHEYFHNWTGNRVTCRDWFQLCLKEGLTVFRDQEFSADERSRTVQRITDVRQLRAYQFPEDQGPLAHSVRPETYIEINNFYTATVYEKGAELVRMIKTIAGDAAFRRGMDLYFKRHDGEAATVEQFIACFADVTGRDFDQFKLWYQQSGTPELVCQLSYDPARKVASLTVEQILAPTPGQLKKKPLHVPLRLALIGHNGAEVPLVLEGGREVKDGVVDVTRRSETFRFTGVPSQPVASLLRGFSAPVKLTIDRSESDLAFLMMHDADQFNRWQACNDYASRLLIQAAKKGDLKPERVDPFAAALKAILVEPGLEPAYLAEMIRLPSEADIARDLARNIDPDAIHGVRKAMSKRLATLLGDEFESLYERMSMRGAFSPDSTSAGRRALRNATLNLLVARGARGDLARLSAHYDRATCMTDQAHALALLAQRSGDLRTDALDDFYNRWKDDHVVVDTWFSVQALAPASSTLSRVRALSKHPLFALTAPNKVRAVIGDFAMRNPVQFNRSDGAGYKFVVDQVLALNAFNPQLAARLLQAFRSWRALEPERRKMAKRELTRIAKAKNLSRDVFEIVTKTLEQPERGG